ARLGQCCGGVATVLFQRFDAATEPLLAALARRVESGEPVAIATAVTRASAGPMLVTTDTAPEALPPAVLAAARALLARQDAAPPGSAAGSRVRSRSLWRASSCKYGNATPPSVRSSCASAGAAADAGGRRAGPGASCGAAPGARGYLQGLSRGGGQRRHRSFGHAGRDSRGARRERRG